MERFYQSLASPVMPIRANERETRYVKLAEEAMVGTTGGSSISVQRDRLSLALDL